MLARLVALDGQPKPITDADAEAWFAELEARYGNRQEEPLDAEALLTAYEARYGNEAADWERQYLASGWLHSARLHVLREALTSAAWGDALRAGHDSGH